MGNTKHLTIVGILVIIASIVTYFVLQAVYQLPLAASTEADILDNMFNVYFGLIAFFFTLIMVFMLYSVVVFRRQPGDDSDGAHIHGHTGLEIAWTIVPTAIVIILAVWGTTTFNQLVSAKEGEMVVSVIGRQWSWSFEYPAQENLASSQLVLPVNQPVLLEMEAEDVLHSFWVPEFRVKQDLVPGRVTTLRFEPTVTGEYKLRCAEMCGLDHTSMLATVQIVSQNEFEDWVTERTTGPDLASLTPAERGAIWAGSDGGFGCIACHTLDGAVAPGPTWLGLYQKEESLDDGSTVSVDEEYLRRSIIDTNGQIVSGFAPNIMPQDFEVRFTEREAEILSSNGIEIDIVEDLIAYIMTLEE